VSQANSGFGCGLLTPLDERKIFGLTRHHAAACARWRRSPAHLVPALAVQDTGRLPGQQCAVSIHRLQPTVEDLTEWTPNDSRPRCQRETSVPLRNISP